MSHISRDLQRLREEKGWRSLIRGIISPGFQAILVYRIFRWLYVRGIPAQPFRFFAERLVEITCGISIPVMTEIGPGLRIHHFGGIILHPGVKAGENLTLYQGVTIGDDGIGPGAPVIGNNVMVGAGAKLLGPIRIGDGVRIGANAVVITDAPPGSAMVGIPARPVR